MSDEHTDRRHERTLPDTDILERAVDALDDPADRSRARRALEGLEGRLEYVREALDAADFCRHRNLMEADELREQLEAVTEERDRLRQGLDEAIERLEYMETS